jgi:outer membrane protein OmpA-like peptidoglycan-associated protein
MKSTKIKTIIASALCLLLFASCSQTKKLNRTQKGGAVGAASGAAIGGIIGNNVGKGNTVLGAMIGAAIGGTAGAVIGNKMDKQANEIRNELPGAQVTRVEEGINVTFDENNPDGSKAGVYFATNQASISANSLLALDKLEKIFKQYPETNILIEGHTDDVGADEYNVSLSEKRAKAVGDHLKSAGIASSRITVKWYGEAQPKAANNSDAGRAANRRVEFAITANEKMKEEAKKEAGK